MSRLSRTNILPSPSSCRQGVHFIEVCYIELPLNQLSLKYYAVYIGGFHADMHSVTQGTLACQVPPPLWEILNIAQPILQSPWLALSHSYPRACQRPVHNGSDNSKSPITPHHHPKA